MKYILDIIMALGVIVGMFMLGVIYGENRMIKQLHEWNIL